MRPSYEALEYLTTFTFASVMAPFPQCIATVTDQVACRLLVSAAPREDPSTTSADNACGVQLRETRVGREGQAYCRQFTCT